LVVGTVGLLLFVIPHFDHDHDTCDIRLIDRLFGPRGDLALCIDLYRKDCGVYPLRLNDLVMRSDALPAKTSWNGPYVRGVEYRLDPWGNALRYEAPGKINTDSYDLCSHGPDGERDTDDDICNYRLEN
jgi:hypothetical protein